MDNGQLKKLVLDMYVLGSTSVFLLKYVKILAQNYNLNLSERDCINLKSAYRS